MLTVLRPYNAIALTLGALLLLSACSTIDWNYPRVPSNAFVHPETTRVGALFQDRTGHRLRQGGARSAEGS